MFDFGKLARFSAFAALTGVLWTIPASSAPLFKSNEVIPADAVVLFDGKSLDEWTYLDGRAAGWKLGKGYMEVLDGNIMSRKQFGDCQIHIEFWLPLMKDAKGQARANSGVYIQGSYEVQILDSYGLVPTPGDCGGLYSVAPPMVNACRPPRQWQTYDIFFRAPRFDTDGNKTQNAKVSVVHNGIWIHEAVELPGPTPGGIGRDLKGLGPIMLQDHGNPLRFRNIWVREIH